jgi:hypothetical protein
VAVPDWILKREVLRVIYKRPTYPDLIDVIVEEEIDDEKLYEALSDHIRNRWHLPKFNVTPASKFYFFFRDMSLDLGYAEHVPGTAIVEDDISTFIKSIDRRHWPTLFAATALRGGIFPDYRDALLPLIAVLHEEAQQPETKEPSQRASSAVPREHSRIAGFEPSTSDTPLARDIGQANLPPKGNIPNSGRKFFPVWAEETAQLRTIQSAISSKHVDQALYYLTPEAVDQWYRIINSSSYSGYDSCRLALRQFAKSAIWREFILNDSFSGCVMLGGGGAATKDLVLINSVLAIRFSKNDTASRVRHTLIDTSYFMLRSSRRYLNSYLDGVGNSNSVKVHAIELDMLNMIGARARIRKLTGNVAWFLTGGTLGNLDEKAFFASVTSKATPGDLLVVAVWCYEGTPTRAFLDELENEYKEDVVRNFVAAPLRAIWSNVDAVGRMKEVEIKVKALLESEPTVSKVRDAIAVTAKVEVPGHGEFTLLQSNRYTQEALIELADEHKWRYQQSFVGPDNLRQIVFRFK